MYIPVRKTVPFIPVKNLSFSMKIPISLSVINLRGIPSHPFREHPTDNLGTRLQEVYGKDFVIRTIGRLGKDVSGVMCYAKTRNSAALFETMESFHKTYTAVISFVRRLAQMLFNLDHDRFSFWMLRAALKTYAGKTATDT